MGFEPMTPVLPRLCATSAPHGLSCRSTPKIDMEPGGQWRIRTSEAFAADLQSAPFGHFGNCPLGSS